MDCSWRNLCGGTLSVVLYSEDSSNAFRPSTGSGRGRPPACVAEATSGRRGPAKIRKGRSDPEGSSDPMGGGLPRSSAEGGWYRGAAPLTISSFSLAAKKQILF